MSLSTAEISDERAREIVYWRRGLPSGLPHSLDEASERFGLTRLQVVHLEKRVLGWPDGPPSKERLDAFYKKVALLHELRKIKELGHV